MNKDLKWIKKHYNEKLAHLCRELFPTLLETEGLLPKLLDEKFAHSKFLYDDIVNGGEKESFKNYIYSLVDEEKGPEIFDVEEPKVLLERAGYDLYECKSEEDIQSFKKYYAPGEELCTFAGGRLKTCMVFFAVKKDVNKIKREDFKTPSRQDEYGTSVISIQFFKGTNNAMSIKNRYNHTVENPDATFSNDLDNIIPGLQKSFEEKYNLNVTNNSGRFVMRGYVRANDGKLYKYNYENFNVYYCPNNIIIDNFQVKKLDSRYILLEEYILDLSEKKIYLYDDYDIPQFYMAFIHSINDVGEIKKINLTKDRERNTVIELYIDSLEEPIIIKLNSKGTITSYINKYVTKIENKFLFFNQSLEELILENCESIGDDCLPRNESIKSLVLPNVKSIGSDFLSANNSIESIVLPNVKSIGSNFLSDNNLIEIIYLLNVERIEDGFLENNQNSLKIIYLPKCKIIGSYFLHKNVTLERLVAPEVTDIGASFLPLNNSLKEVYFPNVENISFDFLYSNNMITKLYLPECKTIDVNFLLRNTSLKELYLPTLVSMENYSLFFNSVLEKIEIPFSAKIPDNIRERMNMLNNRSLNGDDASDNKQLIYVK